MIVEDKKVVGIHYTLTSVEGEELDASAENEPLEYIHGTGNLIPGLEEVLLGKEVGDSLSVSIPPVKGYGLYDDGLIMNIPKDRFDTKEEFTVGMEFMGQTEDGENHVFRVLTVKKDSVKVDGNHPLAGQTLNFEVKIASIRDATEEELSHGHVHGDDEHCCECEDGGCSKDCCGH